MPTLKSKPKKPRLRLQTKSPETQKPSDLQDFIREASEVKQLTQTAGWGILERDLSYYREDLIKKLAYINPKRKEFDELRILFLASDKILNMVDDYQENRNIALEMLNKLENPDLVVPLDIDNEVAVDRGSSPDGH